MILALILVGKNNTGKTAVIDAILLAMGMRNCAEHEFLDAGKPISISVHIEYSESDIMLLHSRSVLCKVKDYERWLADFQSKIPSYQDGILSFTFIVTPNMATRYSDGFSKHNEYIPEVLPKIYHIDQNRNLEALQNDVFRTFPTELCGKRYHHAQKGWGNILAACNGQCLIAYNGGETQFLTVGQMYEQRMVVRKLPEKPAVAKKRAATPDPKKHNETQSGSKVTLSPEEKAALIRRAVPGCKVVHRAFGAGVVVRYQDPIVTIRFARFGEKKFVLFDSAESGLLHFN